MLISCLRQGGDMNKEAIREFYNITDMCKVSLDALKWRNNLSKEDYEHIINQNEILFRKLLTFGVNHIGFDDEDC